MANVDYYGPSMKLAQEFFDLAKEEFQSPEVLRQRDGCEKAYRAATEAVDVLLSFKGEFVPIGEAVAHNLRNDLLYKWSKVDIRIKALRLQYSDYLNYLHGLCFYGISNPKDYQELFVSVQEFLNEVAELLKE